MRSTARLLTIVLVFAYAGPVRAEDPSGGGTLTRSPSALSDADLDARIDFIEQRLEANRKHAYYWQWGWVGVYGSGLVVSSIRAGLTDDDEHQADYVVSAIKAVGGVARMTLAPHPARNGADPLSAMSEDSREAKARKLAKAEDLLLESAKFSRRRWSEKAHLANVLVNVAGGAIIWGLGSPTQGAINAAIGITVGTANILSAPWNGEKDLADYESRFSGGSTRGWDWKVVPTIGGAAVQVTF